ncbi:MAG: DUF488 domain-containing protein [Deltaproteobacteria bacterium]|nr:DUF488 domain-containing protein [Deltaproteobacteria bacterium]
MLKLVTIGGYGYTEQRFFGALRAAKVDTFVDIRQRRGMRGPTYAFLNSGRLQASLAREGIRYVHAKELAPTASIRSVQKDADRAQDVTKHARTTLAPGFVAAYEREILSKFDARSFSTLVGPSTSIVALFCVEGQPDACHRSVVSKRFASELNIPCENLVPTSASGSD